MTTNLQNLTDKFNSLLEQYTETYQNYMNVINSDDNSFIKMPDTTFVGQTNINTINNTTVDECINSCANESSCSGATFDSGLNSCVLSSGKGSVVPAANTTAIVQQGLYYSYQLEKINSELLNTNKQIVSITKNNYGELKKNNIQTQGQEEILENNYVILNSEREEIKKMIGDFETLNSAYESTDINTTTNYYRYVLLLIIAIVLVVILVFSSSQTQRGGSKINIFRNIDMNNVNKRNIILMLLLIIACFFIYK